MNKAILKTYAALIMIVNMCFGQSDAEIILQCRCRVLGVERVLPSNFCSSMNRFGAKLKVRHPAASNLLVLGGKPGCGKSLLAQEFAKQTNSYYMCVKTPSLLKSRFMGGGVKAVDKAFEDALAHIALHNQSVVLNFEEIDAIAIPEDNSSTKETNRAYQQFNMHIDQNEKNPRLIVICTTNRFMKCAEEFRSRCLYIPINQPIKQEKSAICKRMLVDQAKNFLKENFDEIKRMYKDPLEKVKSSLALILAVIEEELDLLKVNHLQQKVTAQVNKCEELFLMLPQEQVEAYSLWVKDLKECLSRKFEESEDNNQFSTTIAELRVSFEQLNSVYISDVESIKATIENMLTHTNSMDNDAIDMSAIQKIEILLNEYKNKLNKLADEEKKLVFTEYQSHFLAFIKVYELAMNAEKINYLSTVLENRSIRFMKKMIENIYELASKVDFNKENLALIKQRVFEAEPEEKSSVWIDKTLSIIKEYGVPASAIGGLCLSAYVHLLQKQAIDRVALKTAEVIGQKIAETVVEKVIEKGVELAAGVVAEKAVELGATSLASAVGAKLAAGAAAQTVVQQSLANIALNSVVAKQALAASAKVAANIAATKAAEGAAVAAATATTGSTAAGVTGTVVQTVTTVATPIISGTAAVGNTVLGAVGVASALVAGAVEVGTITIGAAVYTVYWVVSWAKGD